MEENKLQLQTPFGYAFAKDYVKEDLSELKTNICQSLPWSSSNLSMSSSSR